MLVTVSFLVLGVQLFHLIRLIFLMFRESTTTNGRYSSHHTQCGLCVCVLGVCDELNHIPFSTKTS
jgi:hypothetical protein